MLCCYYTKIGNINLPIQSTARLQKRKQNHKFSVLPVISENELLFPVSTPQVIFEIPKLMSFCCSCCFNFRASKVTASI